MPRYILPVLLTALLLVPACARYVTKADYRPGREVPFDASPTPVKFSKVELLLPPGMDVGFESDGGRFCGWPRYPVSRTVLRDAIDEKFIRQTFHDALEAQGYDVVGSLDIAYDLEDEEDRAEYSVTAKIRDVQMEICHKEADNFMIFFTTRRGDEGEFYMKTDWTVYDALRRTVVYKTTTEGYADRRVPNQEGLTLMFTDAFEMAAHNLSADKGFHDLIVSGIKPEDWRRQKLAVGQDEAERPRAFDPVEPLTIEARPLMTRPFPEASERLRHAAVMVQKFGHGSGFFISDQGHILTSASAVGDGLRTRIVTADDNKLTAEILRVDKARDVALLRLEEIPPGLDIVALPLRTGWPAVGEDVYAIGVPKDYRKHRNSVTKGIISAHRRDMKYGGVRQNYLQADVETHKGSEGAPLLDANGNTVGLAVGGATGPEGIGIGLNYFVPIGEALQALDIVLEGNTAEPLALAP